MLTWKERAIEEAQRVQAEEAEHQRAARENERRRLALAIASKVGYVLSLTIGAELVQWRDDKPYLTVDGVMFTLSDGDTADPGRGLHVVQECPACGDWVLSYRVNEIADVGKALGDFEKNSYFHTCSDGFESEIIRDDYDPAELAEVAV